MMLFFQSFLGTEMARVVGIIPRERRKRPGSLYPPYAVP